MVYVVSDSVYGATVFRSRKKALDYVFDGSPVIEMDDYYVTTLYRNVVEKEVVTHQISGMTDRLGSFTITNAGAIQ